MIDNLQKFYSLLENPGMAAKINKDIILPYYYIPASSTESHPSEFPLVISLHAMKSNVVAPKNRFEKWNLYYPMDCYGYKQEGSYWYHGYPEAPLINTIAEMVNYYRDKNLFNGEVYIIGSSAAGIACVRLAAMLNAQAVYLNVPVLSSDMIQYSFENKSERFAAVFGEEEVSIHATDFITEDTKTCFHIVDQRYGYKDYVAVNSLRFVSRCIELGINVHYEILPIAGHTVNHSTSHILKLFTKYPKNGKVLSTGFPAIVDDDSMLLDKFDPFIEEPKT